jgi:hypothetical protein
LCRSYGFQGAFKILNIAHEESPAQVIHVIARLQVIKSDENSLSEYIIKNLKLRKINLVVLPDWSQPEELLFADLTDVIRIFNEHPDKSQIMLLINTQTLSNSEIEPELLLSSIILNLTLNEGLNFAENQLEISLIPELNSKQWEAFLQKIFGRVILNNEDMETIEMLKLTTFAAFRVDEIANLRMQ